jgi:hypothetical protein
LIGIYLLAHFMLSQEPLISATTRAQKPVTCFLTVSAAAMLCVAAGGLYLLVPVGSSATAHIPHFLMMTLGLLLAFHWALEMVAFIPTKIEVFKTFLRVTILGKTKDIRLVEIVSLTQREGLFRDGIVVRTSNRTYWFENLPHSFKIYDAIQDVAINSEDDKIRNARFIIKRDTGGISWNETIGKKSDAPPPLLSASNGFLRYVLTGPIFIYVLSLAMSLMLPWMATNVGGRPFLIDASSGVILIGLLCLLIFSIGYAIFLPEKVEVYHGRIVIGSETAETVLHKEDIASCALRWRFVTPHIRIRLHNSKVITLRGFAHPKAIVEAINWSEIVTTRQERADNLRTEDDEPETQVKGSRISLKKSDD